MKPRVLQVRTAGVNCDRELVYAFEQAGARVVERHVQELAARPELVRECDLFAIPGGFTYGDDLGGGRILALEIRRYLGDELREHHQAGGSVFGVCNGFQVLVKSGFLPGVEGIEVSLTWNANHRFECRWSRLRAEPGLAHLLPEGTLLPAASAHAEGCFVVGRAADVERLLRERLVAFRYADEGGTPNEAYPHCPNGSAGAIAGLVDPTGRIVGLMPHPERNLSPAHLPDRGAGAWGRGGEGLEFYRSLLSPYRTGAVTGRA